MFVNDLCIIDCNNLGYRKVCFRHERITKNISLEMSSNVYKLKEVTNINYQICFFVFLFVK